LCGGSRSYLEPLTAPYRERIHVDTPVRAVIRDADGVSVISDRFGIQRFDQAVIATHSDQALQLLADASPAERQILGAIPYRNNRVVLHTDHSVLPRRTSAWSSWNYELGTEASAPAVLTYNMTLLQGFKNSTESAPPTFCVTLNRNEPIDPGKILGEFNYAHPVFTVDGLRAQLRWDEINGSNRTWFCGAYWRNGFHEDGVVSGLRVAHALGACPQPQAVG
jgi:predicted NAD/FAD-binding protein